MSKPKRAQREGRSQGETKARLEIESLEQRILLSASWVDGATGEAIEGPTAGDDAFHGSEADDVARSLEGDDQLFGKGGDDVLEGGPGNDALAGGEGVDVASYENAPAGVSVDLTLSGPQDTGGAGTDSLDSIEGVRGSSHDDTFRFSRPEAGRSYSVDGGGGTNTIDLGQVRRADAHFGDGSLQVELGGGESFRIDHENVRTVTFADATVNFVVWDGNGPSADASDPANWDTDALPGPDDVLVFDASSPGAAELGGSFPDTIGGLQLGEGYRGSIRLSEPLGVTGDVVIASGRLDLDGETLSVSGNLERTGAGRLDAGGSALRFEGGGEQSVVLGGAALHDVEVDKPGGTLELADALRVTGSWTTVAGAVDASAATVEFQGDGNTIDASGARFGDVVLDGYRFTLGSELDVDGDLTIERLSRLDGAELRVAGDVTTLDASVGGSSTVVLDGSSQVVGARGGTGELHDLRIESTGTVTVQDHLQISGNLHLASGALDASGATVEFQGDGNTIDASEASFGDVVLDGYRFTLGSELDVDGDLTIERLSRLDGAELRVAGDVTTLDASVGGSSTVVLDGSSQVVGARGGTGELHDLRIESTGTVTVQDHLQISGNLHLASGALDASGATVEFQGDGNTIDASEASFGDVVLDGYRFTLGSELDVDGDLTIERLSRLDGAELRVAGDVTTLDASVGGSSTVVLDGAGDQALGADGAGGTGELHDLRIEKPGGAVVVQDHIQISGDLQHVSGEVDATGATVEFQGDGNRIDAVGVAFGNVILDGYRFTLASDLDVDGDLSVERLSRLEGGSVVVAGDVALHDATIGGTGRIIQLESVEATAGDPVTTGDVLAKVTDLSGDELSIESFTQPAHGSVVHNGDGTFTYTAEPGYAGHDSFTYTVTDEHGNSDVVTASIEVEPPPLSDAELLAMTPREIAALPDAVAADLTPAQIEQLDSRQSLAVARAHADVFDAGQLNAIGHGRFGWVDPAHLGAETFAGIEAEQLNTMREAQFGQLSSEQLATLTPERIESLDSHRSLYLARQNAGDLDADQLNAIGHGRFRHVDVTELSVEQFAGIDAGQLDTMRESQFAKLSAEQLATLTPERIESLDAHRSLYLARQNAGDLDVDQLNAIGHDRFRYVDVTQLSAEQFAGIDADQLNTMRQSQFEALSPEQVATLTPERIESLDSHRSLYLARQNAADLDADQLNAIGHGRFGYVDVTQLSAEQFAGLDAEQLNTMRETQFSKLSGSQLGTLSPERIEDLDSRRSLFLARQNAGQLDVDQLNAIGHGRFGHVDVTELSAAQFSGIDADQLNTMREGQFKALTPEQLATLTPERIEGLDSYRSLFLARQNAGDLDADQLNAIGHGRFRHVDMTDLSPEQFAGLDADQLNSMRQNQFGQLSEEQLATLTPERIEDLDSRRSLYLARQNAADLDADQLNAIGHGRFGHVDVTQLSAEQFASLDGDTLNAMRQSQFKSLSPEQLETLTPERIEELDSRRSLYLARHNAGELDVDQLNAIGHGRFRHVDMTELSVDHFAGIEGDQLNTMRRGQFADLSPEQVATLTPERILELDRYRLRFLLQTQGDHLSPEQLAAIHHGRFGSHVQAAPFVDAGSVEAVDEGDHVTLLAQAADPNDDTLRIEWVQTRGPAVEMIAADTLEPSFIAPEGLVNTDLAFELRVSDGRATSVDDVHVTVRADDDAPEAFAGGDQAVAAGETVTLVGSGSDPEGQQLRYEWVQTAGPPVEIEDPTASTLVIEAPRGGDPSELAFELRVSDGVNHSIDTVVVAVDAEPALPFQPPPDPRPESELARGDVDADEAEDAYAGMEILHETGRVVPTVELEADARGVSEVVQQVIAADTLQTVGGESPLELELDDLTAPSGPRQPVSVDSDRPFAAVFSEGPLALTPDPPSTTEPDSVAEPGLDPPEAPAEGGSFMAAFWSLLRIGGPARGREAGDEQDAKRRHL